MRRSAILVAVAALVAALPAQTSSRRACLPSRAVLPLEPANPHYRPGAPVRMRIGTGHVLVGVVRSSEDCRPIARARLEFFQAVAGGYSTRGWAGRATVFTRRDGTYRFESAMPARYSGGPPHIHFRASAPGFAPVNSTYIVRRGTTRGRVDLVLAPA